ncbi:hypothetical protein CSUI_005920 [Cystoisospora suis]|uniref:Uncharacterized protein n=1 Tax=Cystoisospora suis TaxID=483139 RepID=A0A2C6KVD9_9APIC|nr:hypothetical protein CSUI_005920 [Cystoisospora suis]
MHLRERPVGAAPSPNRLRLSTLPRSSVSVDVYIGVQVFLRIGQLAWSLRSRLSSPVVVWCGREFDVQAAVRSPRFDSSVTKSGDLN